MGLGARPVHLWLEVGEAGTSGRIHPSKPLQSGPRPSELHKGPQACWAWNHPRVCYSCPSLWLADFWGKRQTNSSLPRLW